MPDPYLCDKCGKHVPPVNDSRILLIGYYLEIGDSTGVTMAIAGKSRHLFTTNDCPGTPDIARYLPMYHRLTDDMPKRIKVGGPICHNMRRAWRKMHLLTADENILMQLADPPPEIDYVVITDTSYRARACQIFAQGTSAVVSQQLGIAHNNCYYTFATSSQVAVEQMSYMLFGHWSSDV